MTVPVRGEPAPSWLLLVVAGLTAAWTGLAAALLSRFGHPSGFVLMELIVTWTMVVSGLLILRRRGDNRCGWLLVAAGLSWPVGALIRGDHVGLVLVGFSFTGWYDFFLMWAVLAYPSGRLKDRFDRGVLVGLAAVFSARTLSRVFLHVPPDLTGCQCVRNDFLPITDQRYWLGVETAFKWSLATGMGLVLFSTWRRWWRSSAPGRRTMTPAAMATVFLTFAVVYEFAAGWNSEVGSLSGLRTYTVESWAHAAVAVSLVVGLLRLDHTRSAIVDLVGELGGDLPPQQLTSALRRALGDPTLELVTWAPSLDSYVDESGAIVALPPATSTRAVTVIELAGKSRGVLIHDATLLEDPTAVGAVSAAIRLTADNTALLAANARQMAELEASRRRIVQAADDERRRIERDLHDGAQQRLVTIALALRLAEQRMDASADPSTREAVEAAVAGLGDAVEELRDLARGIHPAVLVEAGLTTALESLADRSSLDVGLDVDLRTEIPRDVAATAYFCVAEALTNVVKHAGVDEAKVTASVDDGRLFISVTDLGVGGASAGVRSGLMGIADRVSAAGGEFAVVSPPGSGTRVEVTLPCGSS